VDGGRLDHDRGALGLVGREGRTVSHLGDPSLGRVELLIPLAGKLGRRVLPGLVGCALEDPDNTPRWGLG